MMDAQTLERLLLDRALGALPPDSAVLLDAYLVEHPVAAAEATGFDATVRLAEQALPTGPLQKTPVFPAGRLLSASIRSRRFALLRYATGLAACLLAGIGIGTFFLAARTSPAAAPVDQVVQYQAPRGLPEPGQHDFWSARRFYERAAGARPPRPPRLIWQSPLTAPKVGDST